MTRILAAIKASFAKLVEEYPADCCWWCQHLLSNHGDRGCNSCANARETVCVFVARHPR